LRFIVDNKDKCHDFYFLSLLKWIEIDNNF